MENILEYILQEPIYDEEDLRKQSISSNHSDNDLRLMSNISPYVPARHSHIQASQKRYITSHNNNSIYNNMDSRVQQSNRKVTTAGGYYGSVQHSKAVEGGGKEDDDRNDNEKEPLLSL